MQATQLQLDTLATYMVWCWRCAEQPRLRKKTALIWAAERLAGNWQSYEDYAPGSGPTNDTPLDATAVLAAADYIAALPAAQQRQLWCRQSGDPLPADLPMAVFDALEPLVPENS